MKFGYNSLNYNKLYIDVGVPLVGTRIKVEDEL